MLEFLKKRDNARLDALIEINNGRANWWQEHSATAEFLLSEGLVQIVAKNAQTRAVKLVCTPKGDEAAIRRRH